MPTIHIYDRIGEQKALWQIATKQIHKRKIFIKKQVRGKDIRGKKFMETILFLRNSLIFNNLHFPRNKEKQ